MHVILDARTLDDHFPGIGRYTFHLAEMLGSRDDLQLTLIVNVRARDSRFPPPERAFPTARIVPVPYSPFAAVGQWAIPRLVDTLQADVYHSPYYIFPYGVTLPTVVTLHDTIPTRFPEYFPPAKRWLIRRLKALAVRRAAHLIADSRTTARDIIGLYRAAPSRISVAPLAPAPYFRPQPPERVAAIRERYSLPEHYFLYVGSAKPHKNLALLLRVWISLHERRSEEIPALVLVGPLGNMGEMSVSAEEVPRVRALGFVPEDALPALYAGATAFLFPSRYEGFGLPVLEAMACGTPVVCSDIPALAEVAGDAAWRIPPEDEEAWQRAIEVVWQDPQERERWRERARERAGQFTWARTADRVVQAYYKTRRAQAP